MAGKKHLWIFILLIAISITLIGIVAGCRQKAEKPTPENTEEKNKEKKLPDTLEDIESSLKNIIRTLDKDKDEEKDKEEVTIESKTEIKQEEDSKKAENETKQETKEEIKKEDPEEKQWKTVEKQVKELHKNWNSLQPDIVQAASPKEAIDEFSNLLNSLTLYAEAKDMQNTLFAANEVYRIIPIFMAQFDSKVPPDLKRMEYHIRNAKYNGMINQWDKSKEDMNKLKSYWSTVKTQVQKEQEDQANQIEFSISELEKVVIQENISLTDIKSKLALENIEKLEEALKK